MKVGILGGTFNPPHLGHLILADTVKEKLNLGKISFIPTNQPPHKNTYLIEAHHRFNMVKLTIAGNKQFEVLDWEIKRGGTSYTIDTLRQLRSKFPKRDFFLIIGSDLANDFYTWREYKQIRHLAKIAVVKRKDFPLKRRANFLTVDVVHIGITSSLVRESIKKHLSIKYLVTQKVFDYVKKHNLYAGK